MKKYDYDIVVIGSGVAGRTAALMMAEAGKKVAVVEAGNWGGSYASYDIPQAAAAHMAKTYYSAIEGEKFGVASANLKYNYPSVLNWIETAKMRSGAGDAKELTEAGITCIAGFAQFLSENEISVGENENITAAKFLIATGSAPAISGISGVILDDDKEKEQSGGVRCLLPYEVFSVPRIPKVVMVVGGGPTGCEVAEYFAEMGAKVLLSEISERVLPKEDPEAGEVIEKRLSDIGVKVLTGSRVLAVADGGVQTLPTGRKVKAAKVTFMRGGQEKSVRVESVVLATGTVPSTDMGLASAGVEFSNKGIHVNGQLQTNVKNIYAAGDVADVKVEKKGSVETPNISSTERAAYEGAVAATNIAGRGRPNVDYRGFVRMTNTYPAVACMGLTEDECIVRDKSCLQILIPLERISIANATDAPDGFVKILTTKDRSKIMGATIVAPEAASMIQELSMIVRTTGSLLDIATSPHVSNGWTEAVKIAAKRLSQ